MTNERHELKYGQREGKVQVATIRDISVSSSREMQKTIRKIKK